MVRPVRSVSLAGSLHLDFHAHPGMDAALKKMCTLGQIPDRELAALEDACPGHRDLRKASGTLGNRGFSWCIERWDKAATELLHFREGVRFAALVDDDDGGSLLDVECVGFEVPIRVGSSGAGLCE